MEKRNIQIWRPFNDLPVSVSVKSIVDDLKGFTISLYDSKEDCDAITKEFIINFSGVYAYRNIDESFHLNSEILDINFDSSLLIVNDGDFLNEFNKLSTGIYKEFAINYTIITPFDIVEIIAHKNGEIKFDTITTNNFQPGVL